MHVLLCPDSFKESMSALEFCKYTSACIKEIHPDWDVTSIPMADGGEGSLDAILPYLKNPHWKTVPCVDAIHRPMEATYLISDDIAYIELAKTSGLASIEKDKRDIMKANTFGTGMVLQDAISENVKEVILFAGGSATVDAGTGIMQALGLTLLDKNNTAIPTSINALPHVRNLKMGKNKLPKGLDFKIICDVSNPLCGPWGAAHTYGPQKGASEKEVKVLDTGMQHLSALLGDLGIDINTEKPGMGAAGGIALATAILNPQLIQGASYFIQKTLLEEHMAKADLIITGEGRYDNQSQMGKITGEIIKRAKDMGKRLVLICGTSNSPLPGANLIRFDQLNLDGEDSFSSPEKYLRLAVRMIEK